MADATVARPPQIATVPSDMPSIRTVVVRFAQAINSILRGSLGCTLQVTLAPGATSSTFSDSRIGPFTYVGLMPMTADAAAALPGLWIETTKGSATIHHASSANTDQTFVACLIG